MNVTALSHFGQDIFSSNPLSNLTTNQKIITAVALVALSCIALAIFLYRRGSFNASVAVQNTLQKTPPTPLRMPQPNIEPTTSIDSTAPTQNTPQTNPLLPQPINDPPKKVYANGVMEEGTFLNGQLNGKGNRKYHPNLGEIKEVDGIFVAGRLNGAGSVTFFDGRSHVGTFVNGHLVEGTKQYPDKDGYTISYEKGTFKNDLLEGEGEVRFHDKMKFIQEGMFENGRLKVQVFVKNLEGDISDYTLFVDESVSNLQNLIASARGIQNDAFRLIFSGRQLMFDETLDSHNIRNKSTIHMVLRLRGD